MLAINEVSPQSAHQKCQADPSALLIDVRTPVEYQQVRAEGAELLPLQDIAVDNIAKLRERVSEGRKIFLICKSGARAGKAAAILQDADVPFEAVVTGGTDAWIAAGLPVIRSRKGISLERQVRIAVGVPVAIFSLLAVLVHPYFALGALFFGCGLTFAGITDWCGMALVIARMPWNRSTPSQGATCSLR